ncbi:MAG: 30S ribosomal protein S20 [Alphaproteobacteria bacterium]|nr:30S ribosomal protein S20 [Alphaproteobacteria bacterium]MCY4229772.1 30S ribosomal protein S20 [Alphaproteobacteria bacterium]MCY4320538.1 30S ribosomal protein S20 [Alphaproteobacteria bacterium]
MAHSSQAKKRVRQNLRSAARNRARASRVRTFIKKVEAAIADGDRDGARMALRHAEPEMARGAQKGKFHRNTMQRKLSRLSRKIKGMAV